MMEMIAVEYLRDQRAELIEMRDIQHLTDADMAEIEEEVNKFREDLIDERKQEYAKESERINAKIELLDEMLEEIEDEDLAVHIETTERTESNEVEVTF